MKWFKSGKSNEEDLKSRGWCQDAGFKIGKLNE